MNGGKTADDTRERQRKGDVHEMSARQQNDVPRADEANDAFVGRRSVRVVVRLRRVGVGSIVLGRSGVVRGRRGKAVDLSKVEDVRADLKRDEETRSES
jgi:hypothetical protein